MPCLEYPPVQGSPRVEFAGKQAEHAFEVLDGSALVLTLDHP